MAVLTSEATIERVEARAYTVPTEEPESDGTIQWRATTIVVVRVYGGGKSGIGYSYTSSGAVDIIRSDLAPKLSGRGVMDTWLCWTILVSATRNLGTNGIAMMAASAVIAALWDLKARLLEIPLASLLGRSREGIPAYGSGGFTSYTNRKLADQLGGWAGEGIAMVKMKIGRDPKADPERIRVAREAIGPETALFVDANGAFSRKQAIAMTDILVKYGVSWYEQPVYHLDFEGFRMVRDRAPSSIEITSGEYGFEPGHFRRMLEAGTVDVLQADATRCGVNGFLEAAALCTSYYLPLSSHTAPALSLPLCCAAGPARNLEYFSDHVRIEEMFFDGVQKPRKGILYPDSERPGLGLELKEKDAEKFVVI